MSQYFRPLFGKKKHQVPIWQFFQIMCVRFVVDYADMMSACTVVNNYMDLIFLRFLQETWQRAVSAKLLSRECSHWLMTTRRVSIVVEQAYLQWRFQGWEFAHQWVNERKSDLLANKSVSLPSLFCLEQSERIARSPSYVISNLSEWLTFALL